ncbi:tail fiber domain-containing protein [Salmonella enterica]|nr:tail fiber domain-containing protein [Salmonella enterica]
MAITKIILQQMVTMDQTSITASRYPRYTVVLGNSISSITAGELTASVDAAAASAAAAKASEIAAKESETNAKFSEQEAAISADSSEASATESAKQATNAGNSASEATLQAGEAKKQAELSKDSATAADVAAQNAEQSRLLAEQAKAAAAASAEAAKLAETTAGDHAINAGAAATEAGGYAAAAKASELAAKESETNAAGSATVAGTEAGNASDEADRAEAAALRAEQVVDGKLDKEDISTFIKAYKTVEAATADLPNRVLGEMILVWSKTASKYGWYKVAGTPEAPVLQLESEESKLLSVNNVQPDEYGNVQVTLPGGNPSLWLGEVTWFPYDKDRGIGYSGVLPADGREVLRVDYPDTWEAIEAGLIPSVTEAEWQAGANLYFSTGNGTTTFRLPDMMQGQAFRAADKNEEDAGKVKEQIPYITTINKKAPQDDGSVTLGWGDISGILPVNQGGTGSNTVDGALKNLDAFKFQRTAIGTTNLNTLDGLKAGVYVQNSNANATSANNYPKNAAGALVVLQNAANVVGGCSQMYYPFNSDDVYVRRGQGVDGSLTWTPWKRFLLEGDHGVGGLSPSNSWDSITVNSFNSAAAGAYHPTTIGFGMTYMHHTDNRFGMQTMGRLNYPMAYRAMDNGTWGTWNYLLSTAKYDSPNELFNYGARIAGGIAVTENFSNKTNPETGVDGFPVNCTAFCYPEGNNAPPTHGVMLGYSGLNQNYRVQNVTYYNQLQDISYRTFNGDTKAWNDWRRVITVKGDGSANDPVELGAKSGFISTSVGSPGYAPTNGGGFQSGYGPNRMVQLWINNAGEAYTRFLIDKATNDTSTPWNRVMYWNANTPTFTTNVDVVTGGNGFRIRGTNQESNQALYISALNGAGGRLWYLGKGDASAATVFYNDLARNSYLLNADGSATIRTRDYAQPTYLDSYRMSIRRASGRTLTFENQDTAAQNATIIHWGNSSRPSVMEFKLDNGYLFYGQQNTDGSRIIKVNGNVECNTLSQVSDRDLKEQIEVIPDARAKLRQLSGYTYRWKENQMPDAGLIAQEVLEVLPEAVNGVTKHVDTGTRDENDNIIYQDERYYGLSYSALVGLLVQGSKEMDAALTAKDQEIAEMKARMDQLEKLVIQLSEKVGGSN